MITGQPGAGRAGDPTDQMKSPGKPARVADLLLDARSWLPFDETAGEDTLTVEPQQSVGQNVSMPNKETVVMSRSAASLPSIGRGQHKLPRAGMMPLCALTTFAARQGELPALECDETAATARSPKRSPPKRGSLVEKRVVECGESMAETCASPKSRTTYKASTLASKHALTHWKVPHGADYLTPYCSACHFNECERCAFCHTSKLAVVRRMHLDKFARVVVTMDPNVSAKTLAEMLSKYARLDEYAREFNEHAEWRFPDHAFCEPHRGELNEYQAKVQALEVAIRELNRQIAEQDAEARLAEEAQADAEIRLSADKERETKTKVSGMFKTVAFKARKKELQEALKATESALDAARSIGELADCGVQTDPENALEKKLAEAEATIERQMHALKQLQGRNVALRRRTAGRRASNIIHKTDAKTLFENIQKMQQQEDTGDNKKKRTKKKSDDARSSSSSDDDGSSSSSSDDDDDDGEKHGDGSRRGKEGARQSVSSRGGRRATRGSGSGTTEFDDDDFEDEDFEVSDVGTQTEEDWDSRRLSGRRSTGHRRATSRGFEADQEDPIILDEIETLPAPDVALALGPLGKYATAKVKDTDRLTVDTTLGLIGNIHERKVLTDISQCACARGGGGIQTKSLASHIFGYMSDKFGIKAMAKKKTNDFVASVRLHALAHARVGNFAKAVGLYPDHEMLFAREMGDVVCGLLRGLVADPKAISETFEGKGPGQFFVSCSKLVASLVGDDGVVLASSATYDCPTLSEWLEPRTIKDMVVKIVDLKQAKKKADKARAAPSRIDGGPQLGVFSDAVDFDEAHAVVAEFFFEAVKTQFANLKHTFALFKRPRPPRGLDYEGFERLLKWALGAQNPAKKERQKLFANIVSAAGARQDDVDVVQDPDRFVIAVMNSGSALSKPADTRTFWQLPMDLEDDSDDTILRLGSDGGPS